MIGGFSVYGANHRDVVVLNEKMTSWVPVCPNATRFAHLLESTRARENHRDFITYYCANILARYIAYGNDVINRIGRLLSPRSFPGGDSGCMSYLIFALPPPPAQKNQP
ncbi:MHC Class I [Eptesicus fuscus gammaherpesvirus]|uniref:MHC Class I n=1 Tax=vespertilionid gammaherpesvirus 3 TaxID=2846598 RepID=A0A2D1A3D4_9GAMA|nr:MHC Class I [Eptesicus fuscus gammaherpesvirus]ATA58230.1 MHC Class I [Eptesicus fuscus gammaherpesvirus]WAH70931.1 MHC class I antigen [Eptesicus fuscus gammaherpesvirus]